MQRWRQFTHSEQADDQEQTQDLMTGLLSVWNLLELIHMKEQEVFEGELVLTWRVQMHKKML